MAETKKPVVLCGCKLLTDVDVVARARAFMAVEGATCQGFYESLGFHIGKTCGWCTEFPGPYLAIAEQELAALSANRKDGGAGTDAGS